MDATFDMFTPIELLKIHQVFQLAPPKEIERWLYQVIDCEETVVTLPETNSNFAPQKNDAWKTLLSLWECDILRGYVKLRGV